MPLPKPNLPPLNRTEGLEIFKKVIDKNFEKFVMEELLANAGEIPRKVPPKVLRKAVEIEGKIFDAIIEDKGILAPQAVAGFINKTTPLAHFPASEKGSEVLIKVLNIFSKPLAPIGHFGLSTLNAYSAYSHVLLAGKSFAVGNFIDTTYHVSVATWNTYRSAHQLINWHTDLTPLDVLLETACVTLTSNLMKVKTLFLKGRKLKNTAEAIGIFIFFSFSKNENIEEDNVLSQEQESEEIIDTSSDTLDSDEDLELLLHALMLDEY